MIQKKSGGVFLKMLNSLTTMRRLAHARALRDLYARNNVTASTPGYKLAETPTVYANGREVMEYRLYKLIDASVVTISHEIHHSVETGKDAALEMKAWPDRPKKSE